MALRTVAGLTRRAGLCAMPSDATGVAVCTYSSTSKFRIVEVRWDNICIPPVAGITGPGPAGLFSKLAQGSRQCQTP